MSSIRLSVVPATDDSQTPVSAAPSHDAGREPDVQLAAMVPQSVKRAVRRRAEEEGTTVRSVLLRALKLACIAEVDDAEIADRRVAAGAMRSGLRRSARR